MCAMRKSTRRMPVTAITAFMPTVERTGDRVSTATCPTLGEL